MPQFVSEALAALHQAAFQTQRPVQILMRQPCVAQVAQAEVERARDARVRARKGQSRVRAQAFEARVAAADTALRRIAAQHAVEWRRFGLDSSLGEVLDEGPWVTQDVLLRGQLVELGDRLAAIVRNHLLVDGLLRLVQTGQLELSEDKLSASDVAEVRAEIHQEAESTALLQHPLDASDPQIGRHGDLLDDDVFDEDLVETQRDSCALLAQEIVDFGRYELLADLFFRQEVTLLDGGASALADDFRALDSHLLVHLLEDPVDEVDLLEIDFDVLEHAQSLDQAHVQDDGRRGQEASARVQPGHTVKQVLDLAEEGHMQVQFRVEHLHLDVFNRLRVDGAIGFFTHAGPGFKEVLLSLHPLLTMRLAELALDIAERVLRAKDNGHCTAQAVVDLQVPDR